MKNTNQKIILISYILNAFSLFFPLVLLLFLMMYISILPGTASDKEGWGFLIAFLAIPVLVIAGVFFLISATITIFLKNRHLYILSVMIIFYYLLIAFLISISAPVFYFYATNILLMYYIYCIVVFYVRDRKNWK